MDSPPAGFLILHGWANHRPAGHWQRWLAESLTARGHVVRYPQLPKPDRPQVKDWLAEIENNLKELPDGRRTVICHSLSCVAWRHLAATASALLPVQRVVLVAPPSATFLRDEPVLRSFADMPGSALMTGSSQLLRLVRSDNDPYCEPSAYAEYEPECVIDILSGEGHFDLVAGYGDWQSMLDWCVGDRATITAR